MFGLVGGGWTGFRTWRDAKDGGSTLLCCCTVEPDYTSTYAKLNRAEEHFQLLHAEITAWYETLDNTFSVERGGYGTRVGVAIRMQGPPGDFLRWTLMAGDCINNARSALDHLVYAIGEYEAATRQTTDHKRNQFVIADCSTEFLKEAKGRLRALPAHIIATIESVQPYNRPHPALPPLLKLLRDFSNADKHRLLELAAAGIMRTSGVLISDETKGPPSVFVLPGPVRDNDIICVMKSEQPDPNLNFRELQIGLEVALWHELRDGDTNPMNKRTSYSVLLPALIAEVRFAIEAVKAAVV